MDKDVIALNCKKLKQIDSNAICRLIKLLENSRRNGAELVLYDINDPLKNFLTLSGIHDYFEILSSSEFEIRYYCG
jgi:anti-anti-sigma factor